MITNEQRQQGRTAAYKLAFACFFEGMSRIDFDSLSMEEQVNFATGAGLGTAQELISAYQYLAWLAEKRADVLSKSIALKLVN